MTTQPEQENQVGFFNNLPPWAKTIVIILTLVPLSVAISGRLIDLSPGPIAQRYLDIKFAEMERATQGTENNIIDALSVGMEAMNEKIDKLTRSIETVDGKVTNVRAQVTAFEGRLNKIEQWACEHSRVQGLRQDSPVFCGGN